MVATSSTRMYAIPSIRATSSIAGFETHPSCSCARQSSGITAEACRPSGYLPTCPFAHSRFAGVKAKLSGCS